VRRGRGSVSRDRDIRLLPFDPQYGERSAACAGALGWPSYADPETALQAFSAPGSITWVALHGEELVGLAHLLTNGVVHAHLSLVGVLPGFRRQGIARRLIEHAFHRCGARWLDLWAEPDSLDFYRSFRHEEHVGFRIYPGDPDRVR